MGLTLGTPASETGKNLLMTLKQTEFDVQKGLVSLLFYLSNTSKVFTAAKQGLRRTIALPVLGHASHLSCGG